MSYKAILEIIIKYKDKLVNRSKRKALRKYVIYFTECLKIKKIKMRVAKTGFEIKKIFYGEIVIFEFLEMKFVNQDNTEEEKLSLENRVKAFEWESDAKNIFALCVLTILISLLIYSNFYVWYCNEFSSIAFRDLRFDALINFSLYSNFVEPNFLTFPELAWANFWLVETLTTLCSNFNMLF